MTDELAGISRAEKRGVREERSEDDKRKRRRENWEENCCQSPAVKKKQSCYNRLFVITESCPLVLGIICVCLEL